MSYVVPLDRVSLADRVGGKAAALGKLMSAGVRVPAGFCVTASALEATAEANGLSAAIRAQLDSSGDLAGARHVRAGIAAATIPLAVSEACVSAYRALSDDAGSLHEQWTSVAVRSSGANEDGGAASYAGIFESYLNICDPDGLLNAVRACWISQWSDTAVAYRANFAVGTDDQGMGVLVQCLVPAAVSGVLFTADPLTGDRSRLVVSSGYGLSPDVMSGLSACDSYVVDPATGTVIDQRLASKRTEIVPDGQAGTQRVDVAPDRQDAATLNAAQVRSLTALAAAVEAVHGHNQDLEWAFHGGELYTVQARPITGLRSTPAGTERSPDPPDGEHYWVRATELFPGPVCPWGLTMFEAFAAGLNKARESWHSPCRLHVSTVDGYVYMADEIHPPVTLADDRRRYEEAIAHAVADTPARWRNEWRDAIEHRGLEMMRTDLRGLSDRHLLDRLHTWLAARVDEETVGGIVGMVPAFAMARLARTGGEIARSLSRDVLHGLPSILVEFETALWRLVRRLEADPWTCHTLQTQPAAEALREMRARPQAWEPVDEFLGRWGYHGMDNFESAPWCEDPTPLIQLLGAKVGGDEEPPSARMARLATQRARAVDQLIAAHPKDADVIRLHVAELTACLPLGQDRYLILTELGYAVARHQLVEIGRRLVNRGQLRSAIDTLYLAPDELDDALGDGRDRREVVARRVRCRRRRVGVRPPASFGAVMSLDATPYVVDSILCDRSSGLQASTDVAAQSDSDDVLAAGIAGSAGSCVGPARVCSTLAEAVMLRRGDVLVCETTTPAWTQYFGLIAGIVTEQGSLLSHPAVVAREYGIPAVVAVPEATSLIPTGERVSIDGSRGLVLRAGARPDSFVACRTQSS